MLEQDSQCPLGKWLVLPIAIWLCSRSEDSLCWCLEARACDIRILALLA